jgi:hypothetical protein
LEPVNLAFDRAGNLMVISYSGNGTVYSFNPEAPADKLTVLPSVQSMPRPGTVPVLPTGDWSLQRSKSGLPLARSHQYLSSDGTVFISAAEGFTSGATSWGIKNSDLLRGFSLAPAAPAKPFYITSESEVTTWSAKVDADGSLSELKVFANQGGESVISDAKGNVYIVAGQVYVYSPSGRLLRTIEVPDRPIQAAFGGRDRRTLFILGRQSLYAIPEFSAP